MKRKAALGPRWLPAGRYLALQLPGWAATILVLALLMEIDVISVRASAALFGLLVLKDLCIYPLVWRAYQTAATTPLEGLIGHRGEVRHELAPQGYVWLRGELWRAETENGERLPSGVTVRVVGAQGLKLIVRRET